MGKSKQYKDQEVPKLSVSEPLTEYCSSTIGKDANTTDVTIYWNMLKGLSSEIKLELISKLSASLLTKKRINLTEKTNWVSQFAGKWNDSRPVDDIIEDIRSSRSANKEIEL